MSREVLVTYQVSYENPDYPGVRLTDQFQFIDVSPEFKATRAYEDSFSDVFVYDTRVLHMEVPTPVVANHFGVGALH